MFRRNLLPLTLLIAMVLAACQAPIVASPTEMSLPPTELPPEAAGDALELTVETAEPGSRFLSSGEGVVSCP